jgi:hypothetical protein
MTQVQPNVKHIDLQIHLKQSWELRPDGTKKNIVWEASLRGVSGAFAGISVLADGPARALSDLWKAIAEQNRLAKLDIASRDTDELAFEWLK